jgi:hypothetical protein
MNNLELLVNYIYILNSSGDNYNIPKTYFTIIHNFLILEDYFFNDVVIAEKEINKYLNLVELNSVEEVYRKFLELYDTTSIIRYHIETFDSIQIINEYLTKNPEIFTKLININKNEF